MRRMATNILWFQCKVESVINNENYDNKEARYIYSSCIRKRCTELQRYALEIIKPCFYDMIKMGFTVSLHRNGDKYIMQLWCKSQKKGNQ